MQVSVDNIDELKRKLTVVIPAEEVEKEVSKKLKHLQKTVRLPGFRPGKVPAKIIESKYSSDVLYEVTGDVINRSYYNAIIEQKIEPASQPDIKPEQIERGKDITFSAEFEVYPEVKNTDIEGMKIVKPVCEITEADITGTIDKIREQKVEWVESKSASVDGDQLILDFIGKVDGEPFEGGSAEKFNLVLGKGGFIPDFEKGLIGVNAGEEKSIDVNFPDDYPVEALAGKSAVFDIKVHNVNNPSLPELNEDFVKSLGLADGSVEALTTQVKENMQRELDARVSSKLRGRVLDALYEKNDLTMPASLLEEEKQNMIARHNQKLQQQGMPASSMPIDEEVLEKESRRHATLSIVAREVIKAHEITVDGAKVDEQLNVMAASYEDPASFVKWYKEDKNRIGQLESSVLEQQMVDKLLESAEVEEETVSFSEFVS